MLELFCTKISAFLLIAVVKCSLGQNQNSTVRLVTYNTGLTPRVEQYGVRKAKIGTSLRDLGADVICLQEVWFSKDIERILNDVGTTYPFSYSAVHRKVGQLEHVPLISAPCMSVEFLTSFFPCAEAYCRHTVGSMNYLACVQEKCAVLEKLEQECITCMILSGYSHLGHSCVDNVRNRFNIPGLLLLSSRPLRHVHVTRFVEKKKLFIPRAFIHAEVEGIGTVACTHTSANLGPVYFEDLDKCTNWREQNLDEARTLVQTQAHAHNAVIMGDLNSSPAVPEADVSSDFNDALDYITGQGYTPSYTERTGICTWCRYNPLSEASRYLILDHILTKNLTVVGTRRVFDDILNEETCPLSDHFGIEITLQTL